MKKLNLPSLTPEESPPLSRLSMDEYLDFCEEQLEFDKKGPEKYPDAYRTPFTLLFKKVVNR